MINTNALVAAALLSLMAGFAVGWVWAHRRAVRRLRRALAAASGQAQRVETAAARGRLLALADAVTTGVVVTQPGALPSPAQTLLDPDTPIDDLPADYGSDVTLVPDCCVDCDEALNIIATWRSELAEVNR